MVLEKFVGLDCGCVLRQLPLPDDDDEAGFDVAPCAMHDTPEGWAEMQYIIDKALFECGVPWIRHEDIRDG